MIRSPTSQINPLIHDKVIKEVGDLCIFVKLHPENPKILEILIQTLPCLNIMETSQNKFSWFDVSDDVKELLILATQTWENTEESTKYMQQALAKTEDNTDVLVAAYRYFYYKNNYVLALTTAEKIIAKIKKEENLPDNWEQLKPILVQRKQEIKIRLFLNAYAASGLVLAKLGELEKAKEISTQIQGIDDKNDFGAGILLDILTRPPEEDE